MFGDHPVSCLPLVDADGRLQGMATRTDLYRSLHRDCAFGEPIASLCPSTVHTVGELAPVREALEVLRRRGVKHVPVLDADGRLAGMLSFRDVLRAAIQVRDGKDAQLAGSSGLRR